jgi:hypothetical protein
LPVSNADKWRLPALPQLCACPFIRRIDSIKQVYAARKQTIIDLL